MNKIVSQEDLRPVLRPDNHLQCGYCPSMLGDQHVYECVCNTRTARFRYSFEFTREVPVSWDDEMVWFHHNEGSWCADNAFNDLPDGCTCMVATVEEIR